MFNRYATKLSSYLRLLSVPLVGAMLAAAPGQAAANPLYAAFVMDASTGEVLFERNSSEARYPASLTKMMTLYMVFQALDEGRIALDSPVPITLRAALEPPTKIGLAPGSTITVENAILSLVTRSANDIATALGEFLGGSPHVFAAMMTAKARQLGMEATTFRNAHGLPNAEQVTTAADMAILGVALREHFPQYYSYFSRREFTFEKQRIGNHNRLLGRVSGVDGIKTGFIRSSGFNLVSSVNRDGRRLVAVVMGGRTAATRDDHVAALIAQNLPKTRRMEEHAPLVAMPAEGEHVYFTYTSTLPLPRSMAAPLPRPEEVAIAH